MKDIKLLNIKTSSFQKNEPVFLLKDKKLIQQK